MFRGKMFDVVKDVFNQRPCIAGGIRWYVMWEQFDQINTFGVERIINEVIPICIANKYSENCIQKMIKPSDTSMEGVMEVVVILVILDH